MRRSGHTRGDGSARTPKPVHDMAVGRAKLAPTQITGDCRANRIVGFVRKSRREIEFRGTSSNAVAVPVQHGLYQASEARRIPRLDPYAS